MKKLIALLLTAVMCLSLAACGGSGESAEQMERYENRIAELEAMLAERDAMLAECDAMLAEYNETINRLLTEKENTETEVTEPENTEPQYETVEITLDNWQEYFELRVYRIITLNGFGEYDGMLTRYFLANKDGIVPDCDNSDVTMEYTCNREVKPFVVDIENMTFTYGEVERSYESDAKIQTLWDMGVYVPTGNILESPSGQVTFIYESGLGGDVEMYGDRILEDRSYKTEDIAHVIVGINVSRVTGTLRFTRQGE